MVDQAKLLGTQKVAIKVALGGGTVGPSSYVGGWEPYCDQPVRFNRRITSRESRPAVSMGRVKILDPLKALEVSMLVPCRKCTKCLQFRQMKWRERAINEIALHKRTWFVTLTFSPTHLAGILLEARSSDIIDVEKAAYAHVQRYFKRLRKGVKENKVGNIIRLARPSAEFKYLAVFERGEKTGRSHYHLFLHETGEKPITKATLEEQWRSFVNCRLVRSDEACRNASYLTKYATKSFSIRPRASVGYGKLHSPKKT